MQQVVALSLATTLVLPSPAFALRQAGLEENAAKQEFLRQLDASAGIPMLAAAGMEEKRVPGEGHPAHRDPRVINNVVSNFSGDDPFEYHLDDRGQTLLREFLSSGELSIIIAVRKMAEFQGQFGTLGEDTANQLLSRAWVAAQGGGLSPYVAHWISNWESMQARAFSDKPLNPQWIQAILKEAPYLTARELQQLYQQYKELVRVARSEPAQNSLITALSDIQDHLERVDEEGWAPLFRTMQRTDMSDLFAILSIFVVRNQSRLEFNVLRNYVKLLRLLSVFIPASDVLERQLRLQQQEEDLDEILGPVGSSTLPTFDERLSEMIASTSPGKPVLGQPIPVWMIRTLREGGPNMSQEQEAIHDNLGSVGAHFMRVLEESLAQDDPQGQPEYEARIDFLRQTAALGASRMLRENPSHHVWMRDLIAEYYTAAGSGPTAYESGLEENEQLKVWMHEKYLSLIAETLYSSVPGHAVGQLQRGQAVPGVNPGWNKYMLGKRMDELLGHLDLSDPRLIHTAIGELRRAPANLLAIEILLRANHPDSSSGIVYSLTRGFGETWYGIPVIPHDYQERIVNYLFYSIQSRKASVQTARSILAEYLSRPDLADAIYHFLPTLRDISADDGVPYLTPQQLAQATQLLARRLGALGLRPTTYGVMQLTWLGWNRETRISPPPGAGNFRPLTVVRDESPTRYTVVSGYIPAHLIFADEGETLPGSYGQIFLLEENLRHPFVANGRQFLPIGITQDGGRALYEDLETGLICSICIDVRRTEREHLEDEIQWLINTFLLDTKLPDIPGARRHLAGLDPRWSRQVQEALLGQLRGIVSPDSLRLLATPLHEIEREIATSESPSQIVGRLREQIGQLPKHYFADPRKNPNGYIQKWEVTLSEGGLDWLREELDLPSWSDPISYLGGLLLAETTQLAISLPPLEKTLLAMKEAGFLSHPDPKASHLQALKEKITLILEGLHDPTPFVPQVWLDSIPIEIREEEIGVFLPEYLKQHWNTPVTGPLLINGHLVPETEWHTYALLPGDNISRPSIQETGLEEGSMTRREFLKAAASAAVGVAVPSLIPGHSEAKPIANPQIAWRFQGEIVVEDLAVGQPASPQPLQLEIAAHETLLGSVQSNFRGTPIRSVSANPERAKEDLEGFTVQDQIYRMVVLDRMLLDGPAQVAKILPGQHVPTFLLYGAEANLLTPAVATAILKLQLPADGLFLLRLRQDDLGQTRLTIYA